MKKVFFLAIVAILFSVCAYAQQDFTGSVMPSNEEVYYHHQMSEPVNVPDNFGESRPCYCMPCPPCPEPIIEKPVTKKATASTGITIENEPNICIDISVPDCLMHNQQTPPPVVNYGSGWSWPWGWNPDWSWLWPLLLLTLLAIMAYQLWRIGNNRQNVTPLAQNPPIQPEAKEPTPDLNLANRALNMAAEKGSSFKYFSDGGFKVDFFPPVIPVNPPATEEKK